MSDLMRQIGEEAARAATALERGEPCPCGDELCEGRALEALLQEKLARVVQTADCLREVARFAGLEGDVVMDTRGADHVRVMWVGDEDQNA